MTGNQELVRLLRGQLPEVAVLREELHRWPDLSGEEQATRDLLRNHLPELQFYPVADTGGILVGRGTQPRIALRVELDGLPITEQSGVPWSSQRSEAMHACGHDVHAAAAVAVVRALQARADTDTRPSVALILQPREEKPPSGARDVVQSGILQDLGVCAVIGAHLQPALTPGAISCTPGAVNASADEFVIEIRGRPGHGAYPHLCDDVVLAMAASINALQQVVARNIDPMQPATITIGSMHAGSAANVLPETAQAKGTIRALGSEVRALLIARINDIVESTAMAYGCVAEVSLHVGEPALVNHEALTHETARVLTELNIAVDQKFRSMGADDFSYFGDQLPALMMFVGVDSSQGGLHHPGFAPNHAIIDLVAQAFLAGYLGAEALISNEDQRR